MSSIDKSQSKNIVETAILIAIFSVLTIVSFYIPFLTLFFLILQTPFIILAYRQGLKNALIGGVVAFFILSLTIGIAQTVVVMVIQFLPGVLVGVLMKKEGRHYSALGFGTLATTFGYISMVIVVQSLMGITVAQVINESTTSLVQVVQTTYSNMGMSQTQIDGLIEGLTKSFAFLKIALPSLLVIVSLFSVLVNYYVSVKILNRLKSNSIIPYISFRNFALPNNLSIGLVIFALLSFITIKLNLIDQTVLVTNLMTVLQGVFSIQGLAFILYFMAFYKLNKVFRVLGIMFLFIVPMGTTMIFLLGIFEQIAKLRLQKPMEMKE